MLFSLSCSGIFLIHIRIVKTFRNPIVMTFVFLNLAFLKSNEQELFSPSHYLLTPYRTSGLRNAIQICSFPFLLLFLQLRSSLSLTQSSQYSLLDIICTFFPSFLIYSLDASRVIFAITLSECVSPVLRSRGMEGFEVWRLINFLALPPLAMQSQKIHSICLGLLIFQLKNKQTILDGSTISFNYKILYFQNKDKFLLLPPMKLPWCTSFQLNFSFFFF